MFIPNPRYAQEVWVELIDTLLDLTDGWDAIYYDEDEDYWRDNCRYGENGDL